jgi:23S rRNA (cytidine1920-2'-O)/16S rRNA (cytidine1409-2'-O)-methyltransferase
VAERGWPVAAVVASPIRGPAGNREFLIHLRPDRDSAPVDLAGQIARAVEEADRC